MGERTPPSYDPNWDLDRETTLWERRLRRKRLIGRLVAAGLCFATVAFTAGAFVVIGGGHGVARRLQGWDAAFWEPALAATRPVPTSARPATIPGKTGSPAPTESAHPHVHHRR